MKIEKLIEDLQGFQKKHPNADVVLMLGPTGGVRYIPDTVWGPSGPGSSVVYIDAINSVKGYSPK